MNCRELLMLQTQSSTYALKKILFAVKTVKAIDLLLRERRPESSTFSDPLPFWSRLNLESLLASMTNNVFSLTGEER